MDIDVAQKCLGELDIGLLKETILAQEATAWSEQTHRQQVYEVHRYTESIVLLFCDNEWPGITVSKEPGWDRLSSVAMPIMQQIIESYYEPGGKILRAMAAKLLPGGQIEPHTDKLESFHHGHRIHIPITTNPGVRFMIQGRPYSFEVGKVYEINNQKLHSVMNAGREDRIHFIFDYAPKSELAGESD